MRELIEQYKRGELSRQEMEKGIRAYWQSLEESDEQYRDFEGEAMWAYIMRHNKRQSHQRLYWIRYVTAAAAVLLFIAGGYYYFEHGKTDSSVHQAVNRQDIPPGHEGAVLTLSNGQQIVLDSANNGALATDGSIRVVKENGAIRYEGANGTVVYNDIQTALGRTWRVNLPDGSKAWLNAGSSIHYPLSFTGTERVVTISGECYFEVKHNTRMPFRVKLPSDAIVEDVGTAFNIKAYSGEPFSTTTVVEGEVLVRQGYQQVSLKSNEQAQINQSGALTNSAVNYLDETIAWKENRFRFRNAGLKQIFKETARWYDMEVQFQEEVPDTYTVSMSRDVPLSKLLQFIEQSGGVHFKIEGKQVIVTR